MNVTQAVRSGTRVELPAAVARPFEVYVNGVRQREGADFQVEERALVFNRELRQEGKLGFWRWASILFGAAFLILCYVVARTVIAPIELPVGVVTAMIGGPFFMWLLVKRT